jgi:hypothetical protein
MQHSLLPEQDAAIEGEKGTITDGIFDWAGTPPSWVLEGMFASLVTETLGMLEVAHEGGTKRLTRAATVQAACAYLYTEVIQLAERLDKVPRSDLSAKHKQVAALFKYMGPVLRRVGSAHLVAGVDNEERAVETAKWLVASVTTMNTVLRDSTSRTARKAAVRSYAHESMEA